jgi:hypothetical protein
MRLHHVGLLLKVASYTRDSASYARWRSGRKSCLNLILHTNLIIDNIIVNVRQELLGKISTVIDAGCVPVKALLRHAILNLRIMSVRIEQDDCISKDVSRIFISKVKILSIIDNIVLTSISEHSLGVTSDVAFRKF